MSDKQKSSDPFAQSDPDLSKQGNHILIHDKSPKGAKVPSLDFDRLREQIKQDNAQEEEE